MAPARFRCIQGCDTYSLDETVYTCRRCGSLLEVEHDMATLRQRSAAAWRELFASRPRGAPGPLGSGVWRYHEWVLPDLALSEVVTLGEGGTPLVAAKTLAAILGVDLLVKQCGHSLTGSFKDLGMTVLVSQVAHLRARGAKIPAVACASTGDTSAALAAYGAAAGLRTLVLLPEGMVSAAQLVQPLAHGARVLAIATDFDGCMRHVQRLSKEEGVYLANSQNSLRIEGQKTVAFEIAEALGYDVPDWVAIPGGNLGNVSALVRGFVMLSELGLTHRLPRVLCAQAAAADPLYRSFQQGFAPLAPLKAGATQATAIRIGNPVSFDKAVAALKATRGIVASVSEQALAQAARRADQSGLYVCPHTAVALAAVAEAIQAGAIKPGERVVVVATAHGLKFTEFATALASHTTHGVDLAAARRPLHVRDDYAAVRHAALEGT